MSPCIPKLELRNRSSRFVKLLPSDGGNTPEKLLKLRSKKVREDRPSCVKASGMFPCSWLKLIAIRCNEKNPLVMSAAGSSPLNWLYLRSRITSLLNELKLPGTLPVSLLPLRSSCSNDERLESSSGMLPCKPFCESTNLCNPVRFPTPAGMGPTRAEFPLKESSLREGPNCVISLGMLKVWFTKQL